MPPKAKADARQEVLVNPANAFGVELSHIERFKKQAIMTFTSMFLTGNADRYVLISVDPAGGGYLSEEAFVIWLIVNDTYALFSGRTVKGHKPGYSYSTVPLMFVVSLLQTIGHAQMSLSELHQFHKLPGTFHMPEVIILLETNFAYGAAVYMQTLFFLEEQKRRIPGLKDVVITFATPVYLWNVTIASKRDEIQIEKRRKEFSSVDYQKAKDELDVVWKARPFLSGAKDTILQEIRTQYGIHLAEEFDQQQVAHMLVEDMVHAAISAVIERVTEQQKTKDKGKKTEEELKAFAVYMKEKVVPVFVKEQKLRRGLQVATKTIAKLNVQMKELLNEGITQPDSRDLFRAKQWPEGVKLVDDVVVFEHEDMMWNAPKSMLGETTTLREKIRAFQHFVYIMTNQSVPRLKILNTNQYTLPFDAKADPCNGIPHILGPGQLVHPFTVLHCVYEQWRNLQVYVDASNRSSILRIRGKAMMDDGEGGESVARDDLWMAFSIGMQWCSCFTRMLPNAGARRRLVEYMRNIRVKVNHAIQQCLRDAALSDDTPIDTSIIPVIISEDPPQIESLPRDEVIEASVAVYAMVNAITLQCHGLHDICRRVIMACAAEGWRPHPGFRIRARKVVRVREIGQRQRFWKQKVGEWLRKEEAREGTMEEFTTTFGVTSSTLRISSAAPYSCLHCWPGLYQREKAVLSLPVGKYLERMQEHLAVLEHLCINALKVHAPLRVYTVPRTSCALALAHPVLQHVSAQKLPVLIIRRLRTLLQSLITLVGELNSNIIAAVDSSTLPQLTERYTTVTTEQAVQDIMPLGLLHRVFFTR